MLSFLVFGNGFMEKGVFLLPYGRLKAIIHSPFEWISFSRNMCLTLSGRNGPPCSEKKMRMLSFFLRTGNMTGNAGGVVPGKKAWKDCIVPMWQGWWSGRTESCWFANVPDKKRPGSFPRGGLIRGNRPGGREAGSPGGSGVSAVPVWCCGVPGVPLRIIRRRCLITSARSGSSLLWGRSRSISFVGLHAGALELSLRYWYFASIGCQFQAIYFELVSWVQERNIGEDADEKRVKIIR